MRVVLDDAVTTRDEFEMSEPYAEQLTLEEMALGEDEFYERRRLEKKRISEEADKERRRRENSNGRSGSTGASGASGNVSVREFDSSSSSSSSSASSTSVVVRSVTVSDCLANRCGTKVTIWSSQYVRWRLINRAFDILRARPGFNSVYNTDRANIVVRHVNGKRYAVLVPFSEMYYEEF